MFPGDLHTALVTQQNVDDDYCACRVKAVGEEDIHIIGAPHFFLNRGPLGVNPALASVKKMNSRGDASRTFNLPRLTLSTRGIE